MPLRPLRTWREALRGKYSKWVGSAFGCIYILTLNALPVDRVHVQVGPGEDGGGDEGARRQVEDLLHPGPRAVAHVNDVARLQSQIGGLGTEDVDRVDHKRLRFTERSTDNEQTIL